MPVVRDVSCECASPPTAVSHISVLAAAPEHIPCLGLPTPAWALLCRQLLVSGLFAVWLHPLS